MTTNSSHQKALALFAEHRGVLWTEEIGVLAEQLMALASALPAPQVPRSEDAYDICARAGAKSLSRDAYCGGPGSAIILATVRRSSQRCALGRCNAESANRGRSSRS